ncbi:MAG: 5'/3'-nucleotidase SurE [Acidimicrobiales bacterium]|nr:5'/3'-nucleotidase SurE [Acidimicrobiales bacterium]
MRILVTNDDGIDSIGLHHLARAAARHGEVVVAAPDSEYSGASAAIGALHLARPEIHKVHIDGIDEAWSVTGAPALCVMFARLGVFGEPFDLVVSGINPGSNVGRSVYHSGTVGAAVTGRIGGISGIAFSQAVEMWGVEGQGWDDVLEAQKWETAAHVADVVIGAFVESPTDEPSVLNVNVPNCEIDELGKWRMTEVATMPPRTLSKATLEPKAGHDHAYRVVMNWGDPIDLPVETDSGAVMKGEVSLTWLSRYTADSPAGCGGVEKTLEQMWGPAQG